MDLPLETQYVVGLALDYPSLTALCSADPNVRQMCTSQHFWYTYYKQHYRSAVEYYPAWNYRVFVIRAENRIKDAELKHLVYIKYNYDVLLREYLASVPDVTTVVMQLLQYAMSFPYTNQLDMILAQRYYKEDTLDDLMQFTKLTSVRSVVGDLIYNHRHMNSVAFKYIFEQRYPAAVQKYLAEPQFARNYTLRLNVAYDNAAAMDVDKVSVSRLYRIIGGDAIDIYQKLYPIPTASHYVIALAYRAVKICALFSTLIIDADDVEEIYQTWSALNKTEVSTIRPELQQVAYHLVQRLSIGGRLAVKGSNNVNELAVAMRTYLPTNT